jgi:thimet oligopeptidase
MPALRTDAAAFVASSPQHLTATCDAVLAAARAQVETLATSPGRPDDEVLGLYDEVMHGVGALGARVNLTREVHPDPAMRAAAEAAEVRLDAFSVELAQDPRVYRALSQVDEARLDEVTRLWRTRALRDFRRAGVDRDEATRGTVKALNEQLTDLGQRFGRAIRDDVRTVALDPAELEGLPQDWLEAHRPGADGKVAVTTSTPDYLPVLLYAHAASAREALWRAYRSRAYPANLEVLRSLLSTRHELATLLGYASWAAFATETKMVRTARAARDFIDRGRASTQRRAEHDLAALLERKRRDVPGAARLDPWDFAYYEDRVKAESYGLDSQALRPYLEFGRVKRGVLEVLGRLFSVRFVAVPDAVVWHPEVETYDLFQGEQRLGRFHLDLHPRDGKYQHAAQFGLTTGRLGKELPEAALVCNFPRAPGLMQHSEVETFFHEFGHLLHELFGGRQRWGGVSGIRTEWDFVEVPSMLLQEWPFDARVLALFARHHLTGEAMPAALVAQLQGARDFGVGLGQRRQFFLSDLSLTLHEGLPPLDTGEVVRRLQAHYQPVRPEWVEGTHFELGFGHLDGYSATYYTYLWSTVIAKDLLTRFGDDLMDVAVAAEYRRKVLEPGGSREAAALVQDFLGRPFSFRAFEAWLEGRR